MHHIVAALQIIIQSFGYRLRMREANNLAVSASMMVAFHFPIDEIAYRCVYAFVLNVYVYLINDYCDMDVDLASPDKARDKVRFMAQHRTVALGAIYGLGLVLFAVAILHSRLLVLAFGANTVLIVAYSRWLKRIPLVDVLAMAAAGASMTMVGVDGSILGLKLLGLLSLVCASFEVIQVVRDEPADRKKDVRTTAVVIGARRAAWLFRALALGAGVYGMFALGSRPAALLALAALLPLSPQRASRMWDVVRLLTGAVWALLVTQIYLGWL